MENTKEIWKNIPNYEGYYQVSSLGNVRSVDRTVVDSMGVERFYRGRILVSNISKGYRYVTLSVNNKIKTFKVSQLAAITFLNHKPDGFKLVVDHVNGDRSDDRVGNLRIVTHRENTSTCFRSNEESFSSKYVGVSWNKRDKIYKSSIHYEGKLVHLGCYSTEIDASNAYQKALGEINDNSFDPNDYAPKFTSKFKGIIFNKKSNKWQSQIYVNGKQKYIGIYPTELEAHEAYQKFKRDNNIK